MKTTTRLQLLLQLALLVVLALNVGETDAFLSVVQVSRGTPFVLAASTTPGADTTTTTESTAGKFIETELRGAAMRLHTRAQAPAEGEAPLKQRELYVTTHADYLAFLVDSLHVYQAMEDIVNERDELAVFRNTGMERTIPLEKDIEFMVQEYVLKRPEPGRAGLEYAEKLRAIKSTPEFVCHFYNHYFAHTAGGRMIGKKMSASLLDKRTLEFYKVCKYIPFCVVVAISYPIVASVSNFLSYSCVFQQWDGDLKEIQATLKQGIEDMAAQWSREEKEECVGGTPAAFMGGGTINSNLAGRKCPF
jgi:heme oxygenase